MIRKFKIEYTLTVETDADTTWDEAAQIARDTMAPARIQPHLDWGELSGLSVALPKEIDAQLSEVPPTGSPEEIPLYTRLTQKAWDDCPSGADLLKVLEDAGIRPSKAWTAEHIVRPAIGYAVGALNRAGVAHGLARFMAGTIEDVDVWLAEAEAAARDAWDAAYDAWAEEADYDVAEAAGAAWDAATAAAGDAAEAAEAAGAAYDAASGAAAWDAAMAESRVAATAAENLRCANAVRELYPNPPEVTL